MFLLVCTITDLYVVILSCTFTTQILTKNFLFHHSLAISTLLASNTDTFKCIEKLAVSSR